MEHNIEMSANADFLSRVELKLVEVSLLPASLRSLQLYIYIFHVSLIVIKPHNVCQDLIKLMISFDAIVF